MNLTFHHFKKDVRQFRLLLSIWFGLLVIDFAVNCGWVGNVEYSQSRGFDNGSNLWTGLLPVVLWVLAGILPSLVVLADSPARHEGFLATRPVRKMELLKAKLLFVFAVIAVPWTASEALYLTSEGLPAWVVVRGSLERIMILLPVAVACSAFAALWPSVARWTRALGIGLACWILIALLYALAAKVLHASWVRGVQPAPGVAAPYVFVLALILFAIWHSRGHRNWQTRWAGLFGCFVTGAVTGLFWKSEPISLKPENPALATKTLADASLEVGPSGIHVMRETSADRPDDPRFNLSLVADVKALPDAQVIERTARNPRLMRPNGVEVSGARRSRFIPLFPEHSWDDRMPLEDVAAWASHFPEDISFRHSEYGPVMFPAGMTFSGFRLPKDSKEFSVDLRLEVELEARLFEWRKIADLPITAGATATNEYGVWRIVSSRAVRHIISEAQVFLERRQVALHTARDSRCSSAFGGPLSRMKLMVYDPQEQIAWISDRSIDAAARAAHTAHPRHFVLLSFSSRPPFTAEEVSRIRLIILEKSWIGSMRQQWNSAAFTLDSKLPRVSGVSSVQRNMDTIPRNELNRRLATLPTPPADAPRREISLYLLEYFRLIDASGKFLDNGSPEVARLASLVPRQLNLLLEGMPAMGPSSKRATLAAIETGTLEEQKPAVIAALRLQPELAEVLWNRGWTDDARTELYDLIRSGQDLPFSVFRAVASFRDPETYPWLLGAFERGPSVPCDDLLHRLGLWQSAGEIVRRKWDRSKLILRPGSSMFGETFVLALRHGDFSALRRAFITIRESNNADPIHEHDIAEAVRQTVQMIGLRENDRHDTVAIANWMRTHQPDDFVFSPARRQFVMKPGTANRDVAP